MDTDAERAGFTYASRQRSPVTLLSPTHKSAEFDPFHDVSRGRMPRPGPDVVHLWPIALDQSEGSRAAHAATLSDDEIERANRFVFQRDRDHFTVARGTLRCILARYVGLVPADVRFGYEQHGKPYLEAQDEHEKLTFNLSHSGGLALCAVATAKQIGVDVERHRTSVDIMGVARSMFSANELATLRRIPEGQRRTAFFDCWVRKEAYIKARGEGLSYALDGFDVSINPGQPAALLRSSEGFNEVRRWGLMAPFLGQGLSAAVAVEQPFARLLVVAETGFRVRRTKAITAHIPPSPCEDFASVDNWTSD